MISRPAARRPASVVVSSTWSDSRVAACWRNARTSAQSTSGSLRGVASGSAASASRMLRRGGAVPAVVASGGGVKIGSPVICGSLIGPPSH